MRITLYSFLVLLLISNIASAAYQWELEELGGENCADGDQPYEGGTVEFLPNGFTITADGGEIWTSEIGCSLVYIVGGLSGDFTVEFTVTDHTCEPVHTWSKLGFMVAQELDPNTPYVYLLASLPSNDTVAVEEKGVKMITRPDQGGVAAPGSGGWVPLEWPMTHKLVREGDTFTGSLSLDGGKTYQSIAMGDKLDNTTLVFTDPVVAGFALCGKGTIDAEAIATVVDIKINGENALAVESAGKLVTTWAELKR